MQPCIGVPYYSFCQAALLMRELFLKLSEVNSLPLDERRGMIVHWAHVCSIMCQATRRAEHLEMLFGSSGGKVFSKKRPLVGLTVLNAVFATNYTVVPPFR